MNDHFSIGDCVKLSTFSGSAVAPIDLESDENFGKLIGSYGRIISIVPPKNISQDRVLVALESDLDALNLPNHNDVKNALWLLRRDLLRV